MNPEEQRLVRKVLLWALGLSVLATPATFAAGPVDLSSRWLAVHTAWLSLVFLALLLRRIGPRTALVTALVMSGTTSFLLVRAAAMEVDSGTVSTHAVALVVLPAVVGIGGPAFLALRTRFAVSVGVLALASQFAGAAIGAGSTTILRAEPILLAARFSVVAIVMFAVVSWVAERRDAARQQEAQAAAAARNRARLRQRVVAEAAHELQTPIAVVRSALETLRDHAEGLSAEEEARTRAALWRGLDRLEERSREVLTIGSTGEASVPRADSDVIDSAHVLRSTVDGLRVGLDGTIVAVEGDPGERALVRCPADEFEHVVENLVSNAAKYGPDDGPVTIHHEVGAQLVTVRVHDCGTTLTDDEANHVFTAGYRAPSTRDAASGTGVGLSLVQRLVTGWGGTVGCDVESNGTTMWFTIPRAPRTEDEADPPRGRQDDHARTGPSD